MAVASSSARKLSKILISLAIQRCRLSGSLCRLSVSLKCFHDSKPPSVRISISDTGVGSSLVEFQGLDFWPLSLSTDKWDGVLSITTTGIHDKDIHHYHLNLREAISSGTRLKKLPSRPKSVGPFSGTEICLSTMEEENVNDFIAWMDRFIQKYDFRFSDGPARAPKVKQVAAGFQYENQSVSGAMSPTSKHGWDFRECMVEDNNCRN